MISTEAAAQRPACIEHRRRSCRAKAENSKTGAGRRSSCGTIMVHFQATNCKAAPYKTASPNLPFVICRFDRIGLASQPFCPLCMSRWNRCGKHSQMSCATRRFLSVLKKTLSLATSPERPLEPPLGGGNSSGTLCEPLPPPRVGSNSTVLSCRASPSPVFLKVQSNSENSLFHCESNREHPLALSGAAGQKGGGAVGCSGHAT